MTFFKWKLGESVYVVLSNILLRGWTPCQWPRRRVSQSHWHRFVFNHFVFFFKVLFLLDEEEEHAEAEQEDGQDVQEDAGEAEAAEEEGEVWEVAQEKQEAADPLKRFSYNKMALF